MSKRELDLQSSLNDLVAKYYELDSVSQRIMQLVALAYRVSNISPPYEYSISNHNSTFYKSVILDLSTQSGKRVTMTEFDSLRGKLFRNGLLEISGTCSDLLVHYLCKIALDKDNININLPLIKREASYSDELKFHTWQKFNLYDIETVTHKDLLRLNLAIHMNDDSIFITRYSSEKQLEILSMYRFMFLHIHLDNEWVESRLPIFQYILCVVKLNHDLCFDVVEVVARKEWVNRILNMPELPESHSIPLLNAQINQLNILYGKHDVVKQQKYSNCWAQNYLQANDLLLTGDSKEALKKFEVSTREFNELINRDYWLFMLDASILYAICLIREQKIDKIATTIIKRLDKYGHMRVIKVLLTGFHALVNNDDKFTKRIVHAVNGDHYTSLVNVMSNKIIEYALYNWLSLLVSPTSINWDMVKVYAKLANEYNLKLAEYIFAELLFQHNSSDKEVAKILKTSLYNGLDILNLIHIKAEWEYTVDKLQELFNVNDTAKKIEAKAERRLAWLIDPSNEDVGVLEQQLKKNGVWTTGKPINATRLSKRIDLDYITTQDSVALVAIEPNPYRSGLFLWNHAKLIKNLVGHPCVFDLSKPTIQLELIKEEPELIVKTIKDGFKIQLSHIISEKKLVIEKISSSKYKVVELDEKFVKLSDVIRNGITLPMIAKNRLLEIICKSNPNLKINADIIDENLPTIEADPNCYLQLTPINDGLTANLFMRPFGDKGSYYFPAKGINSQVIQDENGSPVKCVRNFKIESTQYEQLRSKCPILDMAKIGSFEWNYDDIEESLQLLSELHEYKAQHNLIIEWPKGEAIKFKTNLSVNNLSLKIKSNQQWFEYDGEVTINENEVISLKALLSLLNTDGNSRFVKLDDGKFIALSESFKQQLAELKVLSEGNKIFYLNTSILDELADDAKDAKVDKKWKEHLTHIKNRKQFTPQLPSTLQAELRDYQLEGYNYLSRLSNWRIGACLADDMGLGKTIQAIALLLEYSQYGASLVIAPTSVCFNWVEELNKFAPSLNVYLLHNESDREQIIDKVGVGDILISSYTLLQYESVTINKREWNLLVLDEAQNIKNHTTKRFKAACEINAKCRIALSGTPIENHLGELWSLFGFLNPGLLGGLDSFQKKFITPIANKNHVAKQALKNLIHPYMLRRTKSEVLSELPEKIEQSIFIEPSDEELAFYEVVRQTALENITKIAGQDNKRFSILAEITKLRQACCHSSLVDANINLENSKLTAFLELVQDLIANNHKVLVFSQYVRYLEIVKAVLVDNKINYQYIDGSTPMNQRKTSVTSFQSGSGGDVFLISLKAGGTGLNLTAADYVIILDPWWNPAVEDQAADRAHRMGQKRPVTVYRLIMKNSIEEKIIHMHKDKRDLAGDLLSGQDVSGKLSEDDLMGLMQKF